MMTPRSGVSVDDDEVDGVGDKVEIDTETVAVTQFDSHYHEPALRLAMTTRARSRGEAEETTRLRKE